MIEQLTQRVRGRYDRSMPETAVLERDDTESLDILDPKLLSDWEPVLKKAGSDSNLRRSIMDRIKDGIPPEPDLLADTEEARRKLRQMSKEDVDKKFNEIMKMPIVKRPDDIYKVDRMLDAYAERVQSAMNEIGSDSVPKGEVLRRKSDWSEYGWSEPQRDQVRKDLKEVLHRLNLDDNQAEIIMEVLLANGKKPEKLTRQIIEEKLRVGFRYTRDKDFNPELNDDDYLSQSDLSHTKGEPEIIALRLLGVDQKNIQRHILTDIYEEENDRQLYFGQGPENIEDLAWYIMHTPGKRYAGWGVKGKTPLLEMRIVKNKDGSVDTKKSGYRVNTSNMVRWGRYGMFQDYERDREDPKNFFESISIQGRSALTFNAMLLNPSQYFKSEDGSNYSTLMLELYKEAAVFTTLRTWDVAYRGVMGNREELAKVFRQMFDTKNLMTRGALGANIMGLMTTMPLDFEGVKEGNWESDNIMGAAWIDIYRAYDSLSDYEGLRKILGTGSKFFTQAGWDEAIRQVAKENFKVTGVNKMRVFMSDEYYKYYNKAFDENGEISTAEHRKNFIKLINVFGPKMPPANLEFTVRYILRNAIAEKYGQEVYLRNEKGEFIYENGEIVKTHAFVSNQGETKADKIEDRVADEDSLFVAEAMAWSMTRVFGAVAKNDPDGIGHDWMARVYNTQLMREKYPFRGDMFGNDLTFMQFKKVGVDPFNAIVTEAPVYKTDENGRVLLDKDGLPIALRKKTIMEVLQELSDMKTTSSMWTRELETEYMQIVNQYGVNSEQARIKKEEIDRHKKLSDKAYQNKAQQVTFGQRVLSNYWEDHLSMGMDLYKQIVEAKEIPFEKFTEYTPFGGVRFKGAEFQEAVQKEWIHKIRYMIETYPSLNFNMKVRVIDQTATSRRHWKGDGPGEKPRSGEPIYHEVPLGEAMFGHEMLNIPEFWKLDENGKPINLRDSRGRRMKGKFEIDYEKVQGNKQQVWKQWFMMKVGADLYTHRALHANEPRYNIGYYKNVIDTLSRIPLDIEQNEYNMKDSETKSFFFNKEDIAWLKKLAVVEDFDLYWRAILKDIFMDDDPEKGIGLFLALSLAMKGIISDKV